MRLSISWERRIEVREKAENEEIKRDSKELEKHAEMSDYERPCRERLTQTCFYHSPLTSKINDVNRNLNLPTTIGLLIDL